MAIAEENITRDGGNMAEEIKAARTHAYDAKPVIKYAAQRAVKTGETYYVVARGGKFAFASKPPGPVASHWRVDHLAEVTAHIGGSDKTEYKYLNLEGLA
jgi:hypothetical protein